MSNPRKLLSLLRMAHQLKVPRFIAAMFLSFAAVVLIRRPTVVVTRFQFLRVCPMVFTFSTVRSQTLGGRVKVLRPRRGNIRTTTLLG